MFHFECDYASGAAPQVLRALAQANESQHFGYGEDEHCRAAAELIGRLCAAQVGVHFVPGGTQANLLVAAAALRPFEGVLCADTGHINVHETGAVEATGHKVLALPSVDGRLTADQIRQAAQRHRLDSTREHTVRPGLVYLSHPTELGTLYTRAQLEDISQACREANLLLYVDGARLAYGLAALPEVDLPFLARICDAFTLGGTKAGLLFGEAVVLPHLALSRDFRYHMKQRGAMLAKGWLMGLQFRALLEDGAYVSLAARANAMAQARPGGPGRAFLGGYHGQSNFPHFAPFRPGRPGAVLFRLGLGSRGRSARGRARVHVLHHVPLGGGGAFGGADAGAGWHKR